MHCGEAKNQAKESSRVYWLAKNVAPFLARVYCLAEKEP